MNSDPMYDLVLVYVLFGNSIGLMHVCSLISGCFKNKKKGINRKREVAREFLSPHRWERRAWVQVHISWAIRQRSRGCKVVRLGFYHSCQTKKSFLYIFLSCLLISKGLSTDSILVSLPDFKIQGLR